jgi:hypothetical protein
MAEAVADAEVVATAAGEAPEGSFSAEHARTADAKAHPQT